MNPEINGQPIVIAIGPPLFQAWAKMVKHPDRMEMIENEIAKLEKPDQVRRSSCLYPKAANRFSSSVDGVSSLTIIIFLLSTPSDHTTDFSPLRRRSNFQIPKLHFAYQHVQIQQANRQMQWMPGSLRHTLLR